MDTQKWWFLENVSILPNMATFAIYLEFQDGKHKNLFLLKQV